MKKSSNQYNLKKSNKKKEKLTYKNILKCSICNQKIPNNNEFHHKWDIGEVEDIICESCFNNETV